jgi:hypothetical protein
MRDLPTTPNIAVTISGQWRIHDAYVTIAGPTTRPIWELRGGTSRNVTSQACQYAVNGERRSFALLRPIADQSAQNRVCDLILQAYAEYEEEHATITSNS